MAHSKQAEKRARQNEKRRLRNRADMSRVRNQVKKLMAAVEAGDRAVAEQQLPTTLKHIDKAAEHHAIHKNTAARKKGQAMRAVAKLKK